jgi:hypothetical protein
MRKDGCTKLKANNARKGDAARLWEASGGGILI